MTTEASDTDAPEAPSHIQPLVGDALLNLFARDPYDMTPDDIAQIVAHYQRMRAAGILRVETHKALAEGKPIPKLRNPASADKSPPRSRKSASASLKSVAAASQAAELPQNPGNRCNLRNHGYNHERHPGITG